VFFGLLPKIKLCVEISHVGHDVFFQSASLKAKSRRTKRAVDGGDSAASTNSFLASGFSCSQTESTPAPPPLTQTVRRTTYKEATLDFTSIDSLQAAMREKHYIAERGLATSLYLALNSAD